MINQKGWVLEHNQAFSDFCRQLGINKLDSLSELDDTLMRQAKTSAWRIEQLEAGLSIKDGNKVFYLHRHPFTIKRKHYWQMPYVMPMHAKYQFNFMLAKLCKVLSFVIFVWIIIVTSR